VDPKFPKQKKVLLSRIFLSPELFITICIFRAPAECASSESCRLTFRLVSRGNFLKAYWSLLNILSEKKNRKQITSCFSHVQNCYCYYIFLFFIIKVHCLFGRSKQFILLLVTYDHVFKFFLTGTCRN
jgi:hypothetical protein